MKIPLGWKVGDPDPDGTILPQYLDWLFAPKEAPNGCEQCGKIYEAIGDYPDGEYNVGRCGNPCHECRTAAEAL